MSELPEYINGLPNICGSEGMIEETLRASREKSVFLHESGIDFGRARGSLRHSTAYAPAAHPRWRPRQGL